MTKKKQDKPEAGKIYSLTGAPGTNCIANGNSWAESEFIENEQITVTVIHDCEDCQDMGAIASNTPAGNPEVQRCDTCKVYNSDAEPQSYYDVDNNFSLTVKAGVHLTKYPNSKKWVLENNKEGK